MRVENPSNPSKAIRQQRGLTQRKLATELACSQNYIPALEANSRQPGPKIIDQLLAYFGCDFFDLFEVILVEAKGKHPQPLGPR